MYCIVLVYLAVPIWLPGMYLCNVCVQALCDVKRFNAIQCNAISCDCKSNANTGKYNLYPMYCTGLESKKMSCNVCTVCMCSRCDMVSYVLQCS